MRYKILGVAQTEDHGTVVTPGGPRLRALLAALALRPGQVVTPDTLIDEVWADAPPQDAPGALQALVGRLRRTVGKDAVASAPGGYRLAATRDDVDLYVFERLVRHGTDALDRGDAETAARHLDEALGLWRGPALADLAGHAARPEALHLEATRARVEAGLRLGDAHDAVPRLYELTAAHPYDEPLRALLIRALRAAGRDADALAAYEDTRRTLAEGLGTEPGPALRSLHAELLAAPVPHRPTAPAPRTGNIRPRLTSFVGREAEIDAIRAGLRTARLVTLTGPGGSGKTRLAEEAAAALSQAWLVELAPLDRPEAVPGAVVNALGLRETVLVTSERASVQDDPVASLVEYCASRDLLLVLDNCEHLIGAVARLAETLLTRCPGLTVLATSREPLGVPGEAVRPVEPLAPDQAQRLFAARAAGVRPDADAVLGDEEAVAEICRRLDGLPLAIELAAARLRLLTPREIADRLDDRFRLLTSGSRTVLPRQQTLRAVVDWSWDLLDEAERTMLRALSVFAGGWDLEAAEAVGTGPAADLVGALVDKSLVVADPGAGGTGMRYRMLETIHEYADERAAELPGPRAAAERAHRAWARALAEEADPRLRSAGQLPWIARLETEHDNIRAALGRSLSAGDEEEAAALALAMGWFWWLRNYRHEGVRWFDRVLCLGAALDAGGPGDVPPRDVLARRTAVADPVEALLAVPEDDTRHPLHSVRMRVRMMHILLAFEAGPGDRPPDERMRRYVLRVRNHFAAGGPEAARVPGIIWPLTEFFVGESNDVRPAMDASVANCRVHGGEWEIAASLMFRAHAVVDTSGNVSDVDEDLGELRLLSRRLGDRLVEAQVCSAFGEAAMVRGRYEEARTEYGEALRLAEEVGAFAESPFLIARLAEIAYRSGDRRSALAVLDEASAAADRYGVVDSKAFVLMLRAGIAVEDEDFPGARALWAAARDECERGTPPPQFLAMLGLVEALVTAGEAGPGAALPLLADTVRTAVDDHCADLVVATLVDSAAGLLSDLGDHARAARLLGAAGHWRGDRPAPAPDRAHAERAADAARAALGAERYAAERAGGAGLATADAVAELDAAPRSGPGHRAAPRVPTRR
ncbi:BTAD domain-containing putative transcriptional regulator [Streptomyces olivaceus]|uniref:BTAD domain-containing putative transcriptional regulator n=1 Tax=Streptomyces olivaceus TaxID=47716 RepID=UPI001CCCBAB5|nr:BTAD domain-containing putative transcriptional regulator [Streptomyces olivaceus]MBZ6229393.1 winged helix-turn-helix domain-containing protein [Streptomyces olivaceus]